MRRIIFTQTSTPIAMKEHLSVIPFRGSTKIYVCKHVPFGCAMGESFTQAFPQGQVTAHRWEDTGYYIELDYVPPPQGRPRVTTTGTYNPNQADLDALHWQMKAKRPFSHTLEGPLLVMIHFTYPKPARPKYSCPATRPDLDNRIKLVLDAGNGCLWFDDAQIVELHSSKSYSDV